MNYIVRPNSALPLRFGGGDDVAATLQSIAVLLATRQGTVPLYRDFGLPQNFLDKPMPVAKALLCSEVTEAISHYVPQATVVRVAFEEDHMAGNLTPVVEVAIP